MKIAIVFFLAIFLTGCASGKGIKKKAETNQPTVFELNRSAVYDMLKHFRTCYASSEASRHGFIILFHSEINISDEAVLLKTFELQTEHPDPSGVNVCADEARKVGVERLQTEWLQAKKILTLNQHTVISNGEVSPKARYNTTDLNSGITEVGY